MAVDARKYFEHSLFKIRCSIIFRLFEPIMLKSSLCELSVV